MMMNQKNLQEQYKTLMGKIKVANQEYRELELVGAFAYQKFQENQAHIELLKKKLDEVNEEVRLVSFPIR
jgi:hypothetical protein